MNLEDSAGHVVSGCVPAALEHLELAQHQLRCFIGDPVASVGAALAASPEMAMGHLLHAYLHLLGTEPDGIAVARDSHRRALSLPMTDRERGHLAAVGHLVRGRWADAGRTLEDLSIAYPLDALALQAGHQIDFFRGDSRMLHDRIARALPHWGVETAGFHAVLGMMAFGLEETGRYGRAEALGRRCVEIQPLDGWGQHAVAHVLEMQGRRQEGIAWMRGNLPAWSEGSFLATHNWWHLALYHLDLDQIDEVLTLVDGPICGPASGVVLDMVDASSLLWRLHLRGIDVGERWQALADRWAPLTTAANYAFNDMHAMMAFVAAGRTAGAQALLEAQNAAAERDDDNAGFTLEVGQAATRAIAAFADGRYEQVVQLLRPVLHVAHRFGGSHAQRDVIDRTLIEAARRAGLTSLFEALMHERASARGLVMAPQKAPVELGHQPGVGRTHEVHTGGFVECANRLNHPLQSSTVGGLGAGG
ncbi:tetratricopeptide repeat protein [Roseateles toxinivorans]|uniref:Tetratricopeptide repeat protein 38 n=1 Tax=Roseateles toxinivorans TaxID=270368 RepID=A0A4R6QKQ5_9BURK|nr:tetratricopeptide repeat protein [Roseateles toxinivorans]TDP63963.1 hypothetical protein DES47_104245 [Roseateles toxinivorans]